MVILLCDVILITTDFILILLLRLNSLLEIAEP